MAHPFTQSSLLENGESINPLEGAVALGIQGITRWGITGHSEICKATMPMDGTTVPVALKMYRFRTSDTVERLREREEREKIWWSLVHENVTPLYAVYHLPNQLPVFVSPWYKNGTADVYLRDHPDVDPIIIIFEIACAMEYLHSERVVHGDLKGQNILIDDTGHVRLIDFGASRSVDDRSDLTTPTATTLPWCAPELLSENAGPTMASDVYAFANTALELLTRNIPYCNLAPLGVTRRIHDGIGPLDFSAPICYEVPPSFLTLLNDCWAEASLRPTAAEVKQILESLDV